MIFCHIIVRKLCLHHKSHNCIMVRIYICIPANLHIQLLCSYLVSTNSQEKLFEETQILNLEITIFDLLLQLYLYRITKGYLIVNSLYSVAQQPSTILMHWQIKLTCDWILPLKRKTVYAYIVSYFKEAVRISLLLVSIIHKFDYET